MSSGVTELLLKVTADPTGLQALATQFEATERRIVASAQRAQAAIRGAGGSPADLTRFKSELEQVTAATRTLNAAQEALAQRVESGGRRRAAASTEAQRAMKQEQAETLRLLNTQIGANARATRDQERLTATRVAATSAAKKEADAYRDLHSAARGLAGGLGALWLTYGRIIPLLAGFAVATGIKKSIDLGSEFAYQMAFVGAVSGETGNKLSAAGEAYLKLSANSAFSAAEVARGARTLAQAGFTVEQSMKVMPDLLRFSTLGEIELAQGAEIAAGQMHAFGLSIKDVPHILDSTAKAASLSQTTISEMGQALRQSSTVAQQFGVSIDEMNSLLAVLAQRNVRGSAAGTALRNMFVELDPHTDRARRAFNALGISVTDTEGRYKRIIPLLQEFAKKFAEYDPVSQQRLANAYFNERGAKGFLIALSEANSELVKFNKEIENSDGYLKKASEQVNETFKIQGTQAVNEMEAAFIRAFKNIEPELTKLAKQFKETFGSDEMREGIGGLLTGLLLLIEVVRILGHVAKETKGFLDLLSGAGGSSLPAGPGGGRGLNNYVPQGPGGLTAGFGQILMAMGREKAIDAMSHLFEKLADERKPSVFAELEARIRGRLAPALESQEKIIESMVSGLSMSLASGMDLGPAGGPKRSFDPTAGRRAWDQASDAIRQYRIGEQELKSHTDAQLAILRAYHDAHLMSDEEFNAKEQALFDRSYSEQSARLVAHVRDLQAKRATLDPDKRNDIDTEIMRARTELMKRQEQAQVKIYQDLAKEIKKYTGEGLNAVEAIEKKNKATESEIEALYSLDVAQKSSTVQSIDATIKTLELARAKLLAKSATEEFDGSLTTEAQTAAAGVKALDALIERAKKARDVTVDLARQKIEAENSWLVGAVQGLNDYLKNGVSTAKVVADAFKSGFAAMEEMLFNFITTGKLNFKAFAESVGNDLLKMLIKLNITQPLAQIFMGLLGGGGGGNFTNADGSTNWGGLLQSAGTIGQFGYGMFSGSGTGMAGGAGNWVGGLLGTSTRIGGDMFAAQNTASGYTLANGAPLAQTGVNWAGIAGWVAVAVAAAIASMKFYGQGYTNAGLPSMSDPQYGWASSVPDTKYRLLKALGLSDKWADIASGSPIITRLFGHGATRADARGVEGTITGTSLTGQQWQDFSQRGGTFRSDRRWTENSALHPDQDEFLQTLFGGVGELTGSLGRSLGVNPASILANYSRSFNIQTSENGEALTEEQMVERFGEFFGTVLQEQTSQLLRSAGRTELADYVDKLKGAGTEVAQSVTDLIQIMEAVPKLNMTGLTPEALLAWRKGGETLAEVFQRVTTQLAEFDREFGTEAQNLSGAQTEINLAFEKLGITIPKTKGEFYDLVHGLDLGTEAGRKMFDALMLVAPAFATVANAATAAVNAFNAAASAISPGYGALVNQQNFSGALGAWNQHLVSVGGTAWTEGQATSNIQQWINNPQLMQGALAYAQSLGGNAVNLMTSLLSAFGATLNTTSTAVSSLGGAAGKATSGLASINKGIEEWAKGKVTSELSPLLPGEKLNFALGEYDKVVKGKNKGQFTQTAETLLSLGREYYASSEEYTALFNRVMKDAEALGGFKLDYKSDVQAASISAMRAELASEMRLQRQELVDLKNLSNQLIRTIQEESRTSNMAAKENAEELRRAVVAAIEG